MVLNSLNTIYVLQYYYRLNMVVNDTLGTKYLKTVSFATKEALLTYISELQEDKYFVGIKSIKSVEELELV